MKTYTAKPGDIKRDWYLIDAKDLILGRMSAEAAMILRGKKKPMYSPNLDCGDNVIIVNADKVHLTGNKRVQKKFFWHTGHPGGVKERTAEATLSGKHPERLVEKAIQRMLPRSPMGRKQLSKLHVYAGEAHPHEAQKPVKLDLAKNNRKNAKSE
jgi:large subunit ribosomal protein L13